MRTVARSRATIAGWRSWFDRSACSFPRVTRSSGRALVGAAPKRRTNGWLGSTTSIFPECPSRMADVIAIAVVADIHGNLPALERVVDDIVRRGIETVINLGDHASGPLWPSETIDFLMAQPWTQIAGNCDRAIRALDPSALGPSDRFAFDRLTSAQRAWLDARPATARVNSVFAFHGTPTDDSAYLLETVDSSGARFARPDDVSRRLNGTASDVMLCAHSRVPRIVRLGQSLIV